MNFNGKFWHKPGHLGMTTAQVKEALAGGGGGGYDPHEVNKLQVVMTTEEFFTVLSGTPVTKTVANYDKTKFQPYMTLSVPFDPIICAIFYAVSYNQGDTINPEQTTVFATGFYNTLTQKAYFVTATSTGDPDEDNFLFTATEL